MNPMLRSAASFAASAVFWLAVGLASLVVLWVLFLLLFGRGGVFGSPVELPLEPAQSVSNAPGS